MSHQYRVVPVHRPQPRHHAAALKVWPVLLSVTAGVVLFVGIGLSWRQWDTNRATNQHAAQLITAANNGTGNAAPSTSKPVAGAFEAYSVAADLPRYLLIPKLGVRAIVRSAGLAATGQIGTPSNVYDTDWYTGSSKPGQAGAALIDGHISSWTTPGVFYNLQKLNPDNMLQIERGDGSLLSYKVVKTVVYQNDQVDMAKVLAPVNPAVPGLNLISCAGDVIKGTNEFSERLVVFTEQT